MRLIVNKGSDLNQEPYNVYSFILWVALVTVSGYRERSPFSSYILKNDNRPIKQWAANIIAIGHSQDGKLFIFYFGPIEP